MYGVSNKGHFWHQDYYFRKMFRTLGLRYVYLNSSSEMARSEDLVNLNTNYRYETIVDSTSYVSEVISFISEDVLAKELSAVVLFCPWLPQFSRADLEKMSSIKVPATITIAGITMREQSSTWESKDHPVLFTHQNLFNSDPFKLLWIGEPVPLQFETLKQIRFLPEYAETKINSNLPKKFDFSFHGQLASYRGLFEILLIALFNPNLKVNIRGYSFAAHRVWRPVKYRMFQYTSWKENFIFLFFSAYFLCQSLCSDSYQMLLLAQYHLKMSHN